jgi:hypothetical protein
MEMPLTYNLWSRFDQANYKTTYQQVTQRLLFMYDHDLGFSSING